MAGRKKEVIYGLSGRKLGAAKSAASKCGVPVEEWLYRRSMGLRHCYRCREWKRRSEFQKDRSRQSGRASICKPCLSIATIACQYGITRDEVVQLRKDSCHICGRIGKMEIDHDHDTGEVRGILCSACNNAVGLFQDDPDIMRRAIMYLEKERRRGDG